MPSEVLAYSPGGAGRCGRACQAGAAAEIAMHKVIVSEFLTVDGAMETPERRS